MKKMPDYQNGLVYKIVSNNPEDANIYIGSTVDFKTRQKCHKSDCNNEKRKCYNFKIYKYIRANGGWENFTMILIKYTPCNTRKELTKHEQKAYIEFGATLNGKSPSQTQQEYRQENKAKIKEYDKEYRQLNKAKIKEKQKEYYQANKAKIKEKKKEHYQANMETSMHNVII